MREYTRRLLSDNNRVVLFVAVNIAAVLSGIVAHYTHLPLWSSLLLAVVVCLSFPLWAKRWRIRSASKLGKERRSEWFLSAMVVVISLSIAASWTMFVNLAMLHWYNARDPLWTVPDIMFLLYLPLGTVVGEVVWKATHWRNWKGLHLSLISIYFGFTLGSYIGLIAHGKAPIYLYIAYPLLNLTSFTPLSLAALLIGWLSAPGFLLIRGIGTKRE